MQSRTQANFGIATGDFRFLKLDQTLPQTTVGTFTFPQVDTKLLDLSAHPTGSVSGAIPVLKFNNLQCGLAEGSAGGPFYSGLNNNGGDFYGIAGATTGSSVFWCGVAGEDYRRLRIATSGAILFGGGVTQADTTIVWSAYQTLALTGVIHSTFSASAGDATTTFGNVGNITDLVPTVSLQFKNRDVAGVGASAQIQAYKIGTYANVGARTSGMKLSVINADTLTDMAWLTPTGLGIGRTPAVALDVAGHMGIGNLFVSDLTPDPIFPTVNYFNVITSLEEHTGTDSALRVANAYYYLKEHGKSTPRTFKAAAEIATGNANNFSVGLLTAVFGSAFHNGSGTVDSAAGADFECVNQGSGTITTAKGINGLGSITSGTITNFFGVYGIKAGISGTGAVTHNYAAGFEGDVLLGVTGGVIPKLQFGSSMTAAPDTNLYRSAADTLKTDDSMIVGANLTVTGKTVNYNNVATEGYGTPAIVDDVALTTQSASIATTNFTNAGTAGTYRVNYYLEATTLNAGATSVLATFGYTDDAGATTTVSATLVLTALGRTSGVFYVRLASGNLTYATTLVDVTGLARYALYASVERLS
jgi:hypothetical protein